MSTDTPTIPAETANHVLFHYGHGGYQAGTFTQLLIQTIDHADIVNQDKLALAYPDYVAAIHGVQYDPHGIANLKRIAAGEQPIVLKCKRCSDEDGPFTASGYCETCARGPLPLGGVM